MSAMIGTGEKRTIFESASASSVFGTATRTISQPADASSAICAVVAGTSCVFVVVIDCTTTGAPPPILTPPTEICRLLATASQCTEGYPKKRCVSFCDRDDVDEEDQRQPDERDALVDLPRERAPADALDEREEDVPAVEREQRDKVEQRERHADEREEPEVPRHALLQRLRGRRGRSRRGPESCARQWDLNRDPTPEPSVTRPEIVAALLAARADRVADDLRGGDGSPRSSVHANGSLRSGPSRSRCPFPITVSVIGAPRLARMRRTVARRLSRLAVDRDDRRSPWRRPRVRGRLPCDDRCDVAVVAFDVGPPLTPNMTKRMRNASDDVRGRAGGDNGDALPRRRAPVGVRRRAFLHVAQPAHRLRGARRRTGARRRPPPRAPHTRRERRPSPRR